MKRIVLCFLTAMLALPFHARAQGYPSKAIRFIMPYSPGGSSEILARPIAQELTKNLGQPVVIDYKPGGGTTIADHQVGA
jgi:tripartite-type tricarboxylate transporter receptor subunit TctC